MIEKYFNFEYFEYLNPTAFGIGLFLLTIFFISYYGTQAIPLLKLLQEKGTPIRQDGPASHSSKAGTPAMGGTIILVVVLIISMFFLHIGNSITQIILASLYLFSLIGGFDDYLKIVRNNSVGASPKLKMLFEIVLASLVVWYINQHFEQDEFTTLYIPFAQYGFNIGWLYYPLAVFIITGTSNAVNLTDGLDGLISGLLGISFLFIAYAAYLMFTGSFAQFGLLEYYFNAKEIFVIAIVASGGCFGFLKFNYFPAKVFLGDIGSLSLGALLAVLSIILKLEAYLPLFGMVYVIETLSVILQVGYFRYTEGERLFKMTPIHHHFELLGFREKFVVWGFWFMGAVFTVTALLLLKYDPRVQSIIV